MGPGTTVRSHDEWVCRRRRRQGLTFAGLFAVVLLTTLGALGNWLEWWTFGSRPARVPCPVQTVADAGRTVVNVYNGTDRRGLARAVARELQLRKFRVLVIGNEPSARPVEAVSVRYGSGDEILARTVAAQFPGRVRLVPDPRAREDHSVDVVIGGRYRAMRERSGAAAAIAPEPTPRGCLPPTTPEPGGGGGKS